MATQIPQNNDKHNKRKDIVIKNGNEEIVIPKYKQKGMLDHFMILLGVIMAILIFIVLFDIIYEMSLFGYLFSRDQWRIAAAFMTGQGEYYLDGELTNVPKIYDDNLVLDGFWMPTAINTILFIGAIVVLVVLITYYVRDYVEVFKGLIKSIKSVKGTIEKSVKNGVMADEKDIIVKRKDIVEGADSSSIVEKTEEKDEAAAKENAPKKRGRKSKAELEAEAAAKEAQAKSESGITEGVSVSELSESDLDKLLSDPNAIHLIQNDSSTTKIEPAKTTTKNYTPKSLFSDDD